jgi:hypothetical protein
MRRNAPPSSVSALSWLLASVCLRYDVDIPSVCPRKRGCKHPRFSDFRSDSPLTFTSFWFRFGTLVRFSACVRWTCVLQSWATANRSSFPVLARRLRCFGVALEILCESAYGEAPASVRRSPLRLQRAWCYSDECGNRQRRRRPVNQSHWTDVDAGRCWHNNVYRERIERS